MRIKIGIVLLMIFGSLLPDYQAAEISSSIVVNVVDEDGEPVPNIEYELLGSEGELVQSQITDESGQAKFDVSTLGKYQVNLKTIPMAYKQIATSYQVAVNASGQEYKLEDVLYYSTGVIKIHLVDDENNPIGGSEMTIYDSEGNIVQVITTDENGNATSDPLRNGTYYIQETKAANGYQLDSNRYKITINGESVTEEYITPHNETVQPPIEQPDSMPVEKDLKNEELPNQTLQDEPVNSNVSLASTGSSKTRILLGALVCFALLSTFKVRMRNGN